MRKINTEDIFLLSGLLAETDIIDDLAEFYEENINSENGKLGDMKAGIKGFKIIIKQLQDENAQQYIFEFMANLKGVTAETYAKQNILTTYNDIRKLIKENDLMAFFKSASQLENEEQTTY